MVEGMDDVFFFSALIKHLSLQDIQIINMEGKARLRDRLDAIVSSPRFADVTSLGVVRDANADPEGAFQSICDALRAAKLPVPDCPLKSAADSPRVTVMILPEEGVPGILEDLCLKAVRQDLAMPCLDEYFQCLQQQGLSLPKNLSKAKVQAFLASRPEAGKRLGEAAQAGYWPWDNKTFDQVKNFLKQIES
jgi:hypothetical protein